MKILIIHNKYLKYGGEDTTVEGETKLLLKNEHQVETLFFDNKNIVGIEKLKLIYNVFYNNTSAKILTENLNQQVICTIN